ncbi:MAG: hypothetical protein JSW27_23055 [Phycisphaerales bacterium]|nr:MAG: hypothetical protein JSW27_23055 [Phycisphaerales bacterium]
MRVSGIRKARQARVHACKDFLRLARAHDLLSRAGALMMKTSPKATIWTAGIALSGRLARILGLPGFTRWQALTAPVVVGGGLLGLGAALRYIPRMLSGRLTAVAEANDLNLMEDYRKSQALDHLNLLWEKVFRYESVIRYSADERRAEGEQIGAVRARVIGAMRALEADTRQQLGIASDQDLADVVAAVLSERPLSNNFEKSRAGFLVSALYALRHALPQSSEAYDIGFRLNLYEDYCDGAYFDPSDTKLTEQYAGNVALMQIKRQIRFGKLDALHQVPKQVSAKLWFLLITRKIALGAGKAVQILNDAYDTDLFNSQVLLWPGEEDAPWLERFDGARGEVLKWRQCIVTAALGVDYERACAVLDRAFLPSFEFAAELRARFDPEYTEGSLDDTCEDTGANVTNSLVGDLESFDYRDSALVQAKAFAEKTRRDQAALAEYLSEHHRDLLEDGPTLRAVRIAFHIDQSGLKRLFHSAASEAPRSEVDELIRQAAAENETYTNHLIALRLHHQLTLIQLQTYKQLARRLAFESPAI